jgi:hypothetical protein
MSLSVFRKPVKPTASAERRKIVNCPDAFKVSTTSPAATTGTQAGAAGGATAAGAAFGVWARATPVIKPVMTKADSKRFIEYKSQLEEVSTALSEAERV